MTEAQNTAGELFGEERLLTSLQQHGHLPLKEMLEAVRAAKERGIADAILVGDIDTFAGEAEQFDDITMLAFEFL